MNPVQEMAMNHSHRMRGPRRWATRASVVVGALAVTLGAGVAFAAWSSNGSGTSSAKAGVAGGVTAGTATPSSTLLYPTGSASAPLAITINNPNPYPVKVSAISLGAQAQPASVSGANNASCTVTSAHVSIAAGAVNVTGLSLSIPASGSTTYTTTGNVVTMATDSDDGCQNATFTFANATVTAASG